METYVKPNVIDKKEAKDSVFFPIALSGSMRLLVGRGDDNPAQSLAPRKVAE